MSKSKPNLFIIESLSFDDEKEDLFEGKFLANILRLSGSESRYVYFRTRQELESIADQFEESGYRYLHFSCHGSKSGFDLTLDSISFEDFAEVFKDIIESRRIFFSSCSVVNSRLAAAVLQGTGCYSILGPSKKVGFDKATAFWSSFYHLMLRDDATAMKLATIKKMASALKSLFKVSIKYFTKTNDGSFKEIIL